MKFLQTLWQIGVALFFILLQVSITILFPHLLVNFNIILIAAICWILLRQSYEPIIWSLFLQLILEIFGVLPFGTSLIPLAVSLFLVHKMVQTIFTNRSLYMVFIASAIGIMLFQIIFILLRWGITVWNGGQYYFSIQFFVDTFKMWFIQTAIVAIFYFIIFRLSSARSPKFIHL